MLCSVEVDPTQWPDHSSVMGRFRGGLSQIRQLHWKVPAKIEWPEENWVHSLPDFSGNISRAFAECWHSIEQQASCQFAQVGRPSLKQSQCGRGQTLEARVVTPQHVPIKKGRSGEDQPQFLGGSWRYVQRYRQLRRLQCLVRSLRKHRVVIPTDVWQLWKSIRWSSGYQHGFCVWWRNFGVPLISEVFTEADLLSLHAACAPGVAPGSAEEASWDGILGHSRACIDLPWSPPHLCFAELLLRIVQYDVKGLETSLIRSRYSHSKQLRARELKYVFQDCSRDAPEPVAVLHQTCSGEIESVDSDLGRVYLREEVPFRLGVPLVVQGTAFTLNAQHGATLEIKEQLPEDLSGTLRQTVVKSAVSDILDAFRDEWAPRWQRVQMVGSSQWQQVRDFLKLRMPQQQWVFPSWSVHAFRSVVKRKKSKAAVGADGITRSDLMALPDCAVQKMVQVFQHAEDHAEWPHQLTVGIVNCLEKTPGTLEVSGFRPIVIYPLLYRVWSSYRARQFLLQFLKIAPVGLRGGLPCCQAKSIWYDISVRLECSHFNDGLVIGIVADLVKAFNAIPRLEVYELMHFMGLPAWFVRSWGAFVAMQTRRFKVRGSIGGCIQSTSGFPEGCGLSVCAMAVIDLALDCWLQGMICSPMVYTFVDDWQILHSSPEHHNQILERLQFFVSAIQMDLDARKSFVWGSSAAARKHLRSGDLEVFHHCRNLGAHSNFTKKCGNKVLVDRLAAMPKTWKHFRSSIASYPKKCIALRMLAWPRAFHGIAVVRLGKAHFESSRTSALRGLRCDRVGANPILHLSSLGYTFDPEGWCTLQTFKDAREFGDSNHFRHFLIQSSHDPFSIPKNGPVAILRDRAAVLGWKIEQDGCFSDEVGRFDFFDVSIGELQQRIAWSWPALMAREVSHRQTFDGIQWADLGEARSLFGAFDQTDQVYLRCAMDGTIYTQHGRQHWQTEDSHKCPWCQQPDSFAHRVWECRHFDSCRQCMDSKVVDLVPVLPACLKYHGWPVRTVAQVQFQQTLAAIREIDSGDYHLEHCRGSTHDLFIDGSCLLPGDKTCRIAAFAVTVAQPWISTLEHSLLVAGHVPGLIQSPFRAELVALSHAVSAAQSLSGHVRIWSDCAGVLAKVKGFQEGRKVKVNQQHSDVWNRIFLALQDLGGRVSFHKVVSHIDPSGGQSEVELWAFWHNGLVDRAASAMNNRRSDVFNRIWQTCCRVVVSQRHVFLEIAKLIVRVGKKAHEGTKSNVPTERDLVRTAKYGPKRNDLVIPATVTVSERFASKYGSGFSQTLLQWWLQTGHVFLQRECNLRWISFTQLFCDFLMGTGHHGVWLVNGRWGDDPSMVSDSSTPHFGQRSRWFQMALKVFWEQNRLLISTKLQRPSSATLACWQSSALVTWEQSRLDAVDAMIHGRLGLVSESVRLEHLGQVNWMANMAILFG